MAKVRRSISIDKETLEWINEQIRVKRFKDVSHAIEYAVFQLREKDTEKKA